MAKARQRGYGYSGKDSTKPAQRQEADITNLGGTAPGGLTAFIGGPSQWSTPNALKGVQNIPPGGVIDPASHRSRTTGQMSGALYGNSRAAADGAPDVMRNVPIHPGLVPGEFRTASDANPRSPDGKLEVNYSPTETGGHPLSPDGKHRGESPEIPTQPRGAYRS